MFWQVDSTLAINDSNRGRGVRYVVEKISSLRFAGLRDLGKRVVSDT